VSEQLTLIEEAFGLTVVEGENLQLTLDGGNGPAGAAGAAGAAGPNTVTTSTSTTLTGYIFGNGTTIAGATAAASDPTPSTLVRRDASGAAEFVGLTVTGGTTFGEESLVTFYAVDYDYGAGAASAHRTALGSGATGDALFTALTPQAANTLLANNVVTKAADFTLAEADAGTYMRLTKTGGTQTLTLPTSGISTGAEFQFYRATTQSLVFSGGTVNGTANLASVPNNGAFALKHLGSGTYDFI
jgi:hypothetical protein